MSTVKRTQLFGPHRDRVGHADTEWSVWILGMDDIHDQPTLADALEFAAEHNAIFADLRMSSSSEYDPVLYAVVLHHGYAWNATVEHQLGRDCGHPQCGPCSFDRAQKDDEAVKQEPRCPRCGDKDGPFTAAGYCEPCARPLPLGGVM